MMCPLSGAGNEMGRKVRQPTPFAEDGKRLRVARQAIAPEATLDSYARAAGISPNHYSQHETGVRLITVERALALRAKYKISLDYIYAGDDTGFPVNNSAHFYSGRPNEKS